MAVRIRLKRMGRKKRPFYRLVAIDSRKRRDGLEVERLGWYNPVEKDLSCQMNEERILYWLGQGAQPSDTVSGLFRRSGLSYKWDLMKSGAKSDKIDSLMSDFKDRQKAREDLKEEKNKIKKLESKDNSEQLEAEAPAEEAPVEAAAEEAPAEEVPAEEAPAEESPAEEAPVEAAAEEAPAEESPAEEAPAEEAPEEAAAEEIDKKEK
ncbi:MAG: 30S ribosomal protein S16 [Candidatus Marinimicrobia bacterium]|nr:30S ribosomal protein S16 [Candidatus Neomarinimicrobiota bacterium]